MTSEGEAQDVIQVEDTDRDFLDSYNWNTCVTLAGGEGMHLLCNWISVMEFVPD